MRLDLFFNIANKRQAVRKRPPAYNARINIYFSYRGPEVRIFFLTSDYRTLKTKLFLGGNSEGVTPVLISNTAVKPLSAYGTAREAVWESRTLPGLKFTPCTIWCRVFFWKIGRRSAQI